MDKKYTVHLVIIFLLLAFIVPVCINFMFQKDALYTIFAVSWEANDALAYFGSIISGCGTIFLGWIAILQTDQINKTALEKEKANTKRPFFIITEVASPSQKSTKLWGKGSNGFVYHYSSSQYAFIKIKNIGDGVANNLIINPWGFGDIPKKDRPAFCLAPQHWCTIPIHLSAKTECEGTKYVTVIYENLLCYSYSQKIELCITFEPQVIGANETESGELIPEYEEQFCANIFNIYPQIEHGLNKYNLKSGVYNIN